GCLRIDGNPDAIEQISYLLVHVDGQIDHLLLLVKILLRHSRKVDIALPAVNLLQVIETLSEAFLVENLTGDQTQYRSNKEFIEQLVAGDLYLTDAILVIFF